MEAAVGGFLVVVVVVVRLVVEDDVVGFEVVVELGLFSVASGSNQPPLADPSS